MDDVIIVNGVEYEKKKDMKELPWVVIRSRDAGVFMGQLVKEENGRVELLNSRRIYYWDGAATLSQLSQEGVKNVSNCKFPQPIQNQIVFGVCEIISATKQAVESVAKVPTWKI